MDAEAYDRWYDEHNAIFLTELRLLFSVFKGGKGAELGAGTGRFGSAVGADVLLDLNRDMLSLAKKRTSDLVLGNMCDPPFREGAFDYGLFSFSLGFSGCADLGRLMILPFKRDIYIIDVDRDNTEELYINALEASFGPFRLDLRRLIDVATSLGLHVEGPVNARINVDGHAVTVFAVRLFRPF